MFSGFQVALRGALSRALRIAGTGCALAALGQAAAHADGVVGYVEVGSTSVKTHSDDGSGQTTDSDSSTIRQRGSVLLNQRLWPNLGLLLGAQFERTLDDIDENGVRSKSTFTRIRPQFRLTLRTPVNLAEIAYDRRLDKTEPGNAASSTVVRETLSSALGWTPSDAANFRLELFRIRDFDPQRVVRDKTDDRLQWIANYRPSNALSLYYRGAAAKETDHLAGLDVRRTDHSGRVTYANSWWDRRVSLGSDYSVNYSKTETATTAPGEVYFPLRAFAGLSINSDTPELAALVDNPLLIDDVLETGTGVDLRALDVSRDGSLRNVGLDFGVDTEMNTLWLWVKLPADLPPEDAVHMTWFSWKIYTSSDNRTWFYRETVLPGPGDFDVLRSRLELRFANVTARYIKAVTSPLTLTSQTPWATEFPTIPVTELAAQVRRPAAEVRGETSRTSQVYNLDVRVRLLDAPSLYYDLSCFLTKTNGASARYVVSNGLSLNQQFGPSYSLAARVSREDGREASGTSVAEVYSAALNATPVPALQHSLVFSGRTTLTADVRDEQNSVVLNSIAQLRRGVDVNLALGKTYSAFGETRRAESTLVTAGATLAPHPAVGINMSLQETRDDVVQAGVADEQRPFTRAAEVGVTYRPMSALYFYGARRVESRTELPRQSFNNYSLSWSPFPGGALIFSFRFSEDHNSRLDETTRTVSPTLRWRLGAGSFLDLSYVKLTTDSTLGATATRIAAATIRIAF